MLKRIRLTYPAVAVLLWLIFLAVPLFAVGDSVLTLSIVTFTAGALASSWNILAGYTGQVSLGHAAFFGIGAMVTRLLWVDYGIPIGLSFIVGGLAALIFALITGAPALRLKGIYFAIGTLAMGEALRVTVANVLPIVTRLPAPELIAYDLTPRYYLAYGVLTLTVIASYLIGRSTFGLGLMTIREDEQAAQSLGVNVFTHKMAAFAISAVLAGFAGSAFAFFHVSYYFDLPFGPVWTFDGLLITFVGGIGTIAGPIVGSLFFVLVRDVLAKTWVDFHLILFGVLFIFVVLLLPGGLVEFWTKLVSVASKRARSIAEPP